MDKHNNFTAKVEKRASAAVYDTIREMAIEYRFKPDEKVNEAELAERLGVSRTPIRDALNRLLNEGLIHFQKNRGFYCRSLSVPDLFFLAESRRTIETGMLEQIVVRASDQELVNLREYCENIASNIDVLPACELAKADEAFHSQLATLSHNPISVELLRNVNARIRFMRKIQIEKESIKTTMFREHIAIVDAVASRNLTEARLLMNKHLDLSEDEAAAVLKEGLGKIYLDKIHLDVNFAP